MEVLDPRFALIGAGAALVGSERVRKTVGRSVGYVAAGAIRAGSPVVNAGRDIVDEARDVAGNDTRGTRGKSRRSARSRQRSAA